MGNSPSVEAPEKGPRTSYKLSKPRTGTATAAGLLNPKAVSDSLSRRLSLPYGSAPAPSPTSPVMDPTTLATLLDSNTGAEPGDRSSRQLFRSGSNVEMSHHRRRSSSSSAGVGLEFQDSQHRRRPSRANSVNIASTAEGHEYTRFSYQGSTSVNASRTSIHYDLTLYEAKRMLNLVEEPPLEDESIALESHFQASNSRSIRRKSQPQPQPQQPPTSDTTASLPRVNSDLSLYVPMRRRSLMTPGVATRTVEPRPPLPPKSKARHSLPPTPIRRESTESLGFAMMPMSSLVVKPEDIPRALTPCEADYKQTGAFKHGTLRITNGSPDPSPLPEPSSQPSQGGPHDYLDARRTVMGDKFGSNKAETTVAAENSPRNQKFRPAPIATESPQSRPASVSKVSQALASPAMPQITVQDVSDTLRSHLSKSNLEPTSPALQTTSKHTAMEDDLFEDEQPEYCSEEILDVRIDLNAKAPFPNPKSTSKQRDSKEISRSDSGVVASPTSTDYSHKSLSKADSGYSSNVSLRSFSSKPGGPEKGQRQASETRSFATDNSTLHVKTSTSLDGTPVLVVSEASRKEIPPPLPEKDIVSRVPSNRGISPEVASASRHSSTRSGSTSCEQNDAVAHKDSAIDQSTSSPLSSSNLTSAGSPLSISSVPRKQRRISRLWSGTRAPLTAHATHPSESTGIPSIPSVPEDVQTKLREHTGLLPVSLKRLASKTEASKETLGTISSVGSREGHHLDPPEISGGTGKSDQDVIVNDTKVSDYKITLNISSISSSIVRTASSILSKKSNMRKPVPPHIDLEDLEIDAVVPAVSQEPGKTGQVQNSRVHAEEAYHSEILAITRDGDEAFASNRRGRSTTKSAYEEVDSAMPLTTLQSYEPVNGATRLSSAHLKVPQATSYISSSKSPPPVSMRTRNMGDLRIPSSLRAQSTPPGAVKMHGGPSLSRKSSREGIHSFPPTNTYMVTRNPALSRTSSQESFHGDQRVNTPAGPTTPYRPPVTYRRSMSFQTLSGEHRIPKWEIQAEHDASLSRQPSFVTNRRDSLTGQASQHGARSTSTGRPGSSRQDRHSNPPVLQRQPSYDDDDCVDPTSFARDNGPYPSMLSPNGQTYVSDPWSGRPVPQQYDQYGQATRSAPRGHHRDHCLDRQVQAPPYRVLHSYNSPAYRNAPIWG